MSPSLATSWPNKRGLETHFQRLSKVGELQIKLSTLRLELCTSAVLGDSRRTLYTPPSIALNRWYEMCGTYEIAHILSSRLTNRHAELCTRATHSVSQNCSPTYYREFRITTKFI